MRAKDFISEAKDRYMSDLSTEFVNTTIKNQSGWKPPHGKGKDLAQGATASVWQHIRDPNTVVKVIGGGSYDGRRKDLTASIAFVDFLVHNGHFNKHLPIVHGINIDDSEVVQIRLEKLFPIKNKKLLEKLAQIERLVPFQYESFVDAGNSDLFDAGMRKQNNMAEILDCVDLLRRGALIYKNKKRYRLQDLIIDLHSENWMQRADGTIIAADPWYSRW